jgi:hypothetical protein
MTDEWTPESSKDWKDRGILLVTELTRKRVTDHTVWKLRSTSHDLEEYASMIRMSPQRHDSSCVFPSRTPRKMRIF